MAIPKIIHQIYLQGEANIPDNIKQSIAELRQRNLDWEYHLYDDGRPYYASYVMLRWTFPSDSQHG